MSEILTTVFSQCKNLTQRVIHSSPSSTFGIESLETYELVEVKDGLLATPNNELMKARSITLFPPSIQGYIIDSEQVNPDQIMLGSGNITFRVGKRTSTIKKEFYEYLQGLDVKEYFLSRIPIPGEYSELYPIIAKYKYGFCVVAPLEV